mmetsp:Transcript_22665/g.55959  ORF Transcript_22665/g.55959 Transcript_22665/m.55959 type:complete len:213 (-) Transcript_22665:262-900(-)
MPEAGGRGGAVAGAGGRLCVHGLEASAGGEIEGGCWDLGLGVADVAGGGQGEAVGHDEVEEGRILHVVRVERRADDLNRLHKMLPDLRRRNLCKRSALELVQKDGKCQSTVAGTVGNRKVKGAVAQIVHEAPPDLLEASNLPIVHEEVPPALERVAAALAERHAGARGAHVRKDDGRRDLSGEVVEVLVVPCWPDVGEHAWGYVLIGARTAV